MFLELHNKTFILHDLNMPIYFTFLLFQVDLFTEDWLRQSSWEPSHETILLVHGYAGGDDTLPIIVLRDG